MNKAALAIMGKIRLLYESNQANAGAFVAFHPVALPMTERDLAFLDETPTITLTPTERLRAAADFATLTSYIPSTTAVWTHDGRLLWDVVKTVLTQAQLATDSLSPSEEAELAQARALLHRTQVITNRLTGETTEVPVPTATLASYEEHQAAYLAANQRLNAARVTAEHSDDPTVKAQWEVSREPLELEVRQAERDWIIHGHRNEVDEAFADIDRLTGRGPALRWQEWKHRLNEAERTDLSIDRTFYETAFMPPAFHRAEAADIWTKVTLDASEIASLSEQALRTMPALANSRLVESDVQANLEIRSLSVELARVEIVRPWFDPMLVNSRSWRWPDAQAPLSDGQDPPRGSLVAYTNSLIFARNLTIRLLPQSSQNDAAIEDLKQGTRFSFGPLLLQQLPSTQQPEATAELLSAKLDPRETLLLRDALVRPAGVGPATGLRSTAPSGPVSQSPLLRDISTVAALSHHHSTNVNPVLVIKPTEPTSNTLSAQPTIGGTTLANLKPQILHRMVAVQPTTGICRGKVVDRVSNQPVEDARITFTSADRKSTRSALSDANGDYRVTLPAGLYRVGVRRFGFQDFRTGGRFIIIKTNKTRVLDVMLNSRPDQTKEVELWQSVQLIASICRRVPRAPDPSDTLSWP